MTRQMDDFSVFEKSDGTNWGVCGLKLGLDDPDVPQPRRGHRQGTRTGPRCEGVALV